MGTGTALVEADGRQQKHLGGTGVGGGTLIGLAKYMIGISDFDTLLEMAEKGSLNNVDLSIADITQGEIGNLPPDATASNFGKHNDKANANDLALGIINLVSQTIGMMSIFASRQNGYKKVVLTGKVVKVPQTRKIFDNLKLMFGVDFVIPEHAEFSTAVGAAYAQVLKN
jgi:type II pantothenate kinase